MRGDPVSGFSPITFPDAPNPGGSEDRDSHFNPSQFGEHLKKLKPAAAEGAAEGIGAAAGTAEAGGALAGLAEVAPLLLL